MPATPLAPQSGERVRVRGTAVAIIRVDAAVSAHSHSHHGHGHAQGHGHAHGLRGGGDNERRIFLALLLTGSFMIVEAVGGVLSGSLALIADAGHMLTDTAALALSWFAFRAARRPPDAARSYGYHRSEVLAALINGVVLVLISIWIGIEAVRRLFETAPVEGELMLAVAGAGLAVNLVAFWILHGAERDNMNIRGATLHVAADALGSVAAIAAGIVIVATGWMPIDPILSLLIMGLILRSALSLVFQSGHVLMEGVPPDLDVAALRQAVASELSGIVSVHHVHVWSLTPNQTLLTMHVEIDEAAGHDEVLHRVQAFLAQRFGIHHATIQVECGTCAEDHMPSAHGSAALARHP
jgi:cobalt-zinc-cadmium efflux system protein